MSDSEFTEILLRLIAAVLIGGLLGANREWYGKDVGTRTLALVCLGSALVPLAALHLSLIKGDPTAASRITQGVIQGIMTGIGFIGAGAVLRGERGERVRGVTTAATVWVVAALGIACALSDWRIVAAGLVLALVILVVLHPLDAVLDRHRQRKHPEADAPKST